MFQYSQKKNIVQSFLSLQDTFFRTEKVHSNASDAVDHLLTRSI